MQSPSEAGAGDSGCVTPGAGDALGVGITMGGAVNLRNHFVGEVQRSRSPSPMEVAGGVGWGGPRRMGESSPHPSPKSNFAELDRRDRRLAGSVGSIPRRPVGEGPPQRMVAEPSGQHGIAGYSGGEGMERQRSGQSHSRDIGTQDQMFVDRLEPGAWAGSGSPVRGRGRGRGMVRGRGRHGFI